MGDQPAETQVSDRQGKGCRSPYIRDAFLFLSETSEPVDGYITCNAWPVWRQTYRCLPSPELDTNWMHPWIGLDWIGSNIGKNWMDLLDWIAANGWCFVFYVIEEPCRLSKNESCLTVAYLILLDVNSKTSVMYFKGRLMLVLDCILLVFNQRATMIQFFWLFYR